MCTGALLALAVSVLHRQGQGVGVHGAIGSSDGALLFVWTLVAIGTTALFTLVPSAHARWSHRARRGGALALAAHRAGEGVPG